MVVTGSLIARPDYNTATPMVTVSPDTLKQSGQVALEQGLVQLPQFSVATAGTGPFIGGSGQQNINLRNLGPQRNLVLLDGRRLLPSASDGTVDLQRLPQGIIGNVEIITGGASAVYGSDAVSGVVNLKTRAPMQGLEIATTYGTTQSFGGSQFASMPWAAWKPMTTAATSCLRSNIPSRQGQLCLIFSISSRIILCPWSMANLCPAPIRFHRM